MEWEQARRAGDWSLGPGAGDGDGDGDGDTTRSLPLPLPLALPPLALARLVLVLVLVLFAACTPALLNTCGTPPACHGVSVSRGSARGTSAPAPSLVLHPTPYLTRACAAAIPIACCPTRTHAAPAHRRQPLVARRRRRLLHPPVGFHRVHPTQLATRCACWASMSTMSTILSHWPCPAVHGPGQGSRSTAASTVQ